MTQMKHEGKSKRENGRRESEGGGAISNQTFIDFQNHLLPTSEQKICFMFERSQKY